MYSCYKKIADLIHPITVNNVSIDIMDYTVKELGFRELISGLQREKYARLKIDGQIMMSETPMEQRTNVSFITQAHGDVLIGGLGIGMIIMAIQDKLEVNTITVLENNKDVIEAVASQLPFNDKVRILNEDVFTWKPDKKFNCSYMDIWFYPDENAYEEMKKLKRKYGHSLKSIKEDPKRFNECWAEYYAKNGCRLI